MLGVTHLPDARPSPLAARVALTASAVALAGLLLAPLVTLGRNSLDAAPALLHLGGGLLDLSGSGIKPVTAPAVIALGWAAFALLLVTLVGALRRERWLWIPALLASLCAGVGVLLLGQTLGAEIARVSADSGLRPGARAQLRSYYSGGGMNLGLFLPLLGGLIAAGAGLSARPDWWARFNRLRGLLVPLSAVGLAVLAGAVIVLLVQAPVNNAGAALGAWQAWLARSDLVYFVYSTLFSPLTNFGLFLESLKLATPLIFTGLSVAFAFRAGLFNIGAPGQLTIGAIAGALTALYLPQSLGWLLLPLSVIAAGAGGALWGAIPGYLKARFGSSEVINTIMLNYIATGLFIFMISSNTFPFLGKTYNLPFKAEGYEAQTNELPQAAHLPTLVNLLNVGGPERTVLSLGWLFAALSFWGLRLALRGQRWRTPGALLGAALILALTWKIGVPVDVVGSQLNAAFLIALACVALFSVLMWRTATGYSLRAVGLSPKAAEYGGVNVARSTVLAMTVAGMFAGLAGTHYVQGGALVDYRLKQALPANVGFDGIAVALMGQSTPGGVVAASLLFGTIDTGGVDVDTKLEAVNKDIVTVLKALIVLFIAAGGFLSRRITDPPLLALGGKGDGSGGGQANQGKPAALAPAGSAAPSGVLSGALPNVGQSSRGEPVSSETERSLGEVAESGAGHSDGRGPQGGQ